MTTATAPQPAAVAAYLRSLASRGARGHLGLCRTDLEMLVAAAGLIEIAYAPRVPAVTEVERRREGGE